MDLRIESNRDGKFDSVCLQGNDISNILEEMKKRNLCNVVINSAWGWDRSLTLDFLYENDWIEGVELIDEDYDITPINCLRKLRFLGISPSRIKGRIDLANFEKLEYLSIWWQKNKFLNLETCTKCIHVYISSFPNKDLSSFHKYTQLKALVINFSKLESFEGIQDCHCLNKLDIFSAQQLRSINIPVKIANGITHFLLEKCMQIESYKILEDMVNLEALYFCDAAPIHSIDFLREMNKLQYAYIGVAIQDRNVSFLKERGFEFKYAKSYN
ncbi:MAG: hypothetical protein QM731_03975 [Chitinophagaceae bacterium]